MRKSLIQPLQFLSSEILFRRRVELLAEGKMGGEETGKDEALLKCRRV